MLDIEKIRAAALAATQGEWVVTDNIYAADGKRIASYRMLAREEAEHYNNATYIAAANPSAVLELIARLEAAEEKNTALLVAIKAKDAALKSCKHGYQGFGGKEWSFDLKLVQKALALSPSAELLEQRDRKRDAKLLREAAMACDSIDDGVVSLHDLAAK